MAKKNAGSNATTNKPSGLELLRAAGFGISKQKSRLWDIDNAVEIVPDIFDMGSATASLYMGIEYESFFVIISEGDESVEKPIPFITGAVNAEDIDLDEANLSARKTAYAILDLEGFFEAVEADSIRIIEVAALRDDKELGISKGDKAFRAELI